MEKRLGLAIVLSLLVLVSWQALVSKRYPIEQQEVTTKTEPVKPIVPKPAPIVSVEQEIPLSSLLSYSQEEFDLVFIEPQAAIKEVIFKKYKDYPFSLKQGFLLEDKSLEFKQEARTSNSITFVHSDQNKKIIKKFIFSNSLYSIELDIKVQNLTEGPLSIDLPIILGVLDFTSNGINMRYQDVVVSKRNKITWLRARRDKLEDEVKFLGLRDRYFCVIIEPENRMLNGLVRFDKTNKLSQVALSSLSANIEPGTQIGQKFYIYLGPQDVKMINNINPEWSGIVNYGIFDFISQILLKILELLHRIVHNWGWSIVILSCLVYLILYPLTLKQMRSMKQMQILQPRIEELRKLYKDNPQKLNKQIMEFYREHKVNPLGGCLPLILQMPIFVALYQALMRSVVLRGANFLWIEDLSEPDRLFILPTALPIIGEEINLLPILMIIGMFVQQKMSMAATGASSAEHQKFMMLFFLVFFAIVFYHMPAGLVLYWLINSTFMLINQIRIRRAHG